MQIFKNAVFFMLIGTLVLFVACGGVKPEITTGTRVISTAPLTGATGLPLNTTVTATFSTKMKPETITDSSFFIKETASGTTVPGAVTYNIPTKTAVFTPVSNLAYQRNYTITITTAATDTSGKPLVMPCVWTFTTTRNPDTTPPQVESVNPAAGTTGFPRGNNIEIVFNESMSPAAISVSTIQIRNDVGTPVSGSVSYNSGSHTAVFDPTGDLVFGTWYTVTVGTGAADLAGNHLVSEFTSTFRVEADTYPPHVASTLPVADATNVALSTALKAVFDEDVNPATVTDATFLVNNGAVAGTVSYDAPTKTATFTPSAPFGSETAYTATITTGVRDLAGNALAAGHEWSFTTTDGAAPGVSSVTPVDGATGQSIVGAITATFNDDMDPSTITSSTFQVRDGLGNPVTGALTYNGGTKTATFTPANNMDYATVHTVTLTTGLQDTSGNAMADNYVFSFTTKARHWTVMVYADADNNLEPYIMNDVAEMKAGYVDDQGIDLIVLVDRISGYSSDTTAFGQDFTDTRMYRITHGKAVRISGGTEFPEITTSSSYEANMAGANTLKKFIRSCKSTYPAGRYALIMSNHGGGSRAMGVDSSVSTPTKAICSDDTTGTDILYTAEITDVLGPDESVDLFGLDACLMGSVEFGYQFRPGNGGFNAQYMVASPPLEWNDGWQYTNIFSRIRSGGGNNGTTDTMAGGQESYYDPATMTAQQLGGIIVEEQYDSTSSDSTQALSCYDLSRVSAVKSAVDTLAVSLATESEKADFESIRGNYLSCPTMHYFNAGQCLYPWDEWVQYPFFDLYDLCNRTANSTNFSNTVRMNAMVAASAVSSMIVYSFGNSSYSGFVHGFNGLHIFFPDGDETVTADSGTTWIRSWAYEWWYNAIDTNEWWPPANGISHLYGKLAWCMEGLNPSVGAVGNWFEMLDSWFDYANGADGSSNGYQW